MAGLGWQKKAGVRLITVGLYYINAASNSSVEPKVTKSLSGIASAPNVTALDLEPFGRPLLPPVTRLGFLAFLSSSSIPFSALIDLWCAEITSSCDLIVLFWVCLLYTSPSPRD